MDEGGVGGGVRQGSKWLDLRGGVWLEGRLFVREKGGWRSFVCRPFGNRRWWWWRVATDGKPVSPPHNGLNPRIFDSASHTHTLGDRKSHSGASTVKETRAKVEEVGQKSN